MTVRIAFAVQPRGDWNDVTEVVPIVDGIRLTDRIHRFEQDRGMESRAISYGGLIPAYFRFGPAHAHYLGAGGASSKEGSKTPLLGCECGEWGCWPLLARIVVGQLTVARTDFEQPYRTDRDYSDFGPFVFDRAAYESAMAELDDIWAKESA